MKVLVLGHRGMLGHVVSRYLAEQGHEVITSGQRYAGSIDLGDCEAVVNCAGVVRAEMPGLYVTNALLPLHVAARLAGRLLVHPSTDCVFDGLHGWYSVTAPPNALDDYGLSKRLGEGCLGSPTAVVLRTSIVGPGERGLLGWFLRQTEPVDGWVNHFWNGITTLQWAKVCAAALAGEVLPGLHQPTVEAPVSKFTLLGMFARTFDHSIDIRPVTAGWLNRTLQPTLVMPPLEEQLTELREWYG